MSSSERVPLESVAWLATLTPSMEKYGGLLAKHGYETTYALGLITDPGELQDPVGLWADDANFIYSNLNAPRNLRNQWGRLLHKIPIGTSMVQFFQSSPVPLLAQHVAVLAELGFDSLAAFKNLTLDDISVLTKIPLGHRQALYEIALLMNDPIVIPKNISLDLTTFLAHVVPPVHHLIGSMRLTRPKLSTIAEFMTIKRDEVSDMSALLIGQRRLLWNIILRLRTHWMDPV